jgi:hypothetical protein
MEKMFGTLLVALFLVIPHVGAQENADQFKKNLDKKFEQFQKNVKDEYSELERSIDEQFAAMLKSTWLQMERIRGEVADTTPKPDTVPSARPTAKVKAGAPATTSSPVETRKKTVEVSVTQGTPVTFPFFGTPVTIMCDPKMKLPLTGGISGNAISAYWKSQSESNNRSVVEQLKEIRKQLGLNDWEFYQLTDQFAGALYDASGNERDLLAWFLMLKSGYDARIGISGGKVFLLLPTKNVLYGVPFFLVHSNRYYLVSSRDSKGAESVRTYDGNYKTVGIIDLNLDNTPDITRNVLKRSFIFQYEGKKYTLNVDINKNVIDLYEMYPQTDFEVYFHAPVSSETGSQLMEGLRAIIRGKSEVEAVDILLSFVQNAFTYKTDEAQFGREKFFFPEETLYYPYSDCEDRAVLFTYLVKSLLGLEVVGLHYPGHMAAGVRFTAAVQGDSVEYRGARYVVCDPTYINAYHGECMPQFNHIAPKIIAFQ